MKKQLLPFITFLAIMMMANTAYAAPTLIPGSTTVYWEITGTTLYITGTGAMPDFANQDNQPWAASRTAITQLSIADGITAIGNYAFSYCSNLTSLTLSADLTSIGNSAFRVCNSLSGALLIPDKVTTIGSSAFYECYNLTSLTLSAELTSIGNLAFWNCSSLSGALLIPDRVTSIGGGAFMGCSSLSGALLIPDKVTSIGSQAFRDCRNLTSLTLPADLTSIEWAVFQSCSELSGALIIPDKVTSIGNQAFAGCSKLTSLTLPAELTSIVIGAFSGCSSLSGALLIPDKVTSIENYAFQNCRNLTSLSLSADLTSIGNYAFQNCSGFTQITARSITPPTLGDGSFGGVPTDIPLYVPCQSQAVYEAAEVWNEFQVIPVGGVGVMPIHSADLSMGSVEIVEMNCESLVATFRAIPKAGHRFVQWNDGNTKNPRSEVITAESSFTAEFAVVNHTITVLSNNEAMGTVSGGGTYMETTTATLYANHNYSFRFVQWNDGNTENPRYVTVSGDATYTAEFAMDPLTTYYYITVQSNNPSMGTVVGSGSYLHNSTVTLVAVPANNHNFVRWNDGDTQNPRYVVALQDSTFTAEFQSVNAVEAVQAGAGISLYPNPASDKLYINSSLPVKSVMVIDALGNIVIQQTNPASTININNLPQGLYIVKICSQTGESVHKMIKK